MGSSSKTTSVPLPAKSVASRSQACLAEVEKKHKDTGSRAKVIILMGKTGAGKSSYLEDVTDSSGHADQSVDAITLKFQISKAIIENEKYFIMDTPGFDPENEQSAFLQIVRGIQAVQPYGDIVGLLFFTCINVPRFDAFDRKLVTFIRAFCGDYYIPNITFITTFWTAPGPKQQAVFNRQLENLRRNWNDEFAGNAPRSYQHGRKYDADGEDTGSFLDWFEDREQIAQHGKDMIARYYGGQRHNNIVPKIVRDLAAGTPVHETDAGRLLRVNSTSHTTASSDTPSEEDQETSPNQNTSSNGTSSGHQEQPTAGRRRSDGNIPRAENPQQGPSMFERVGNLLGNVLDSLGRNMHINVNVGDGGRNGGGVNRQMPGPGHAVNYVQLDPNSVVDTMRGLGMDPSRDNRLRLANEFGIGGTPFSAEWNDSIRRNLQRRSRR